MLDEQNDGAAEESEQVEAPQHGFASFDGPESMPEPEPGDDGFEDQEIYEERLQSPPATFTALDEHTPMEPGLQPFKARQNELLVDGADPDPSYDVEGHKAIRETRSEAWRASVENHAKENPAFSKQYNHALSVRAGQLQKEYTWATKDQINTQIANEELAVVGRALASNESPVRMFQRMFTNSGVVPPLQRKTESVDDVFNALESVDTDTLNDQQFEEVFRRINSVSNPMRP